MIKVRRNIQPQGASTLVLLTGITAVCSWGMYRVVMANRKRKVWKMEDQDIRLSVMPFLVAEADVQRVFIKGLNDQSETELMKNHSGWEVGESVYKTTFMRALGLPGPRWELKRY